MTRYSADREARLDPTSFAGGYFRNAVYRHWDPYEDIPQAGLEEDRRKLLDVDVSAAEFDELRTTLAMFGAGEEAVTEDLAPLMLVLDDIDDQLFLSSQIYEEAKHTAFFDRYWREVIDPVATEMGVEVTHPTDPRYFNEDYEALFDKTHDAMFRLLEADTPTHRAEAFCHYHLVVESVLAQTGYFGLQSTFSQTGSDEVSLREDEEFEYDRLDGLVEGITRVRSDEGRHVGWGMRKTRELIHDEDVNAAVVQETLGDLLPHVMGIVEHTSGTGADPMPLMEYAQDKLQRRIEVLTEADADLPPIEELVAIEGAPDVRAADDD